MNTLWPASGSKAASSNLRGALHAARKVLDPAMGRHYLASEGESLVLRPGTDLWVDVEVFEQAASTARRSQDPAVYRAALGLYAGEFLPEDRYEDWAEARREQLHQLYLSLLVELAALYEGRGEYAPAIEVLSKATSEEPTLEEAHASVMRLYALSGRPERALAQYERLRDALQGGIGTRPADTTRRLRDEIAAGKLLPRPPSDAARPVPSDVAKHNLPAPVTSFVGREQEMVEIKKALAMTRLLTLTGAGGTGKTRLSLEVARDLAGTYPEGTWLVELAPLSEGGLVAQEFTNVLGSQERPGESLTDVLVETLAAKEMLLVVDNCEHVVEEAARLVDILLASCPRLRVLATSREPLGVSGEVNRAVPPLSLPVTRSGGATAEDLMHHEAVRLFVDRARLRLLDFEMTQENAEAVARVCRKLAGLPLAIELATARLGALPVEQVAQKLEASLDVLKDSGRTGAARQKTLRATLDWSHDLLSADERVLFRWLSVFAGGWTLEAAEDVCSGGDIGLEEVLDLLGGLVDKSLVEAGASEAAAVRYGMLEPVRQYGRDKLAESGEVADLRDRHAAFFLALAEEAEPQLSGPLQAAWSKRLEGEHDNLREALSWLLESGEAESTLRLVAALWRFWHLRGHLSEGTRWIEQALARSEPAASPVRVKALEGMGWMTHSQGKDDQARAHYEEMLELSRELGDKGSIATALNSLGTVAAYQGDNERARALLRENLVVLEELEEENPATPLKRFHALNLLGHLAIYGEGDYARGAALWEESLALARAVNDADRIGMMLANLAYPAVLRGDYERTRELCEEALAVARELGSAGVEFEPTAYINLGLAALGQGAHERAMGSFREALVISRAVGTNPQVVETLEGIASLFAALGDATRAARHWGAAEAAREASGITLPPAERALHEPHLASARSQLGEEAWAEALAQGQAMSLEEATDYALSEGQPYAPAGPVHSTSPADGPPSDLTRREREVAALIARGLTNRRISEELRISERTVDAHVRKILGKLGFGSRAQVASWATERLPLHE